MIEVKDPAVNPQNDWRFDKKDLVRHQLRNSILWLFNELHPLSHYPKTRRMEDNNE